MALKHQNLINSQFGSKSNEKIFMQEHAKSTIRQKTVSDWRMRHYIILLFFVGMNTYTNSIFDKIYF